MGRPAEKKRKKLSTLGLGAFFLLFILKTVLLIAEAGLIDSAEAKESEVPYYFKLSVDSDKHNDYGLTYPVTYQFSIPSGSSNLKAYRKYTESEDWTEITEKMSSDFFNGIEAVRFDYDNNKAYISVAFSDESDDIFLKIASPSGIFAVGAYDGITKYYLFYYLKKSQVTRDEAQCDISFPHQSFCQTGN